jgi:hypothetical protein
MHSADDFADNSSTTRNFSLHFSELQQQQQQLPMESFEMPGYVPSPNSNNDVYIPLSLRTSAASVAVLETAPPLSNDSSFFQIHQLRSTQSAHCGAAIHDREHNILKEDPEILLSNDHIDIVPNLSHSTLRLPSHDQTEMDILSSTPKISAATSSFDDNPALQLDQDEDPSVIK